MVQPQRQHECRHRITCAILAGMMACVVFASAFAEQAKARRTDAHYQLESEMPLGAIGSRQLTRGGPLRGYFQPVEITAPRGTVISPAVEGRFQKSPAGDANVGLLVGAAYRFRVTGIPRNQGRELFPTVEVIDRLYPPQGQKAKYPIPIELTEEEMGLALEGKYVVRVIYLENPSDPFAIRQENKTQRYSNVGPNADPLREADRRGRPVAILRLGSRLPGAAGPDATFLHGCPPLVRYAPTISPKPPVPKKEEPKKLKPALPIEASNTGASGKAPVVDLTIANRKPVTR